MAAYRTTTAPYWGGEDRNHVVAGPIVDKVSSAVVLRDGPGS
jgi:hypothetical protein